MMITPHNSERMRLGVNVDHVATLRQVRKTQYPDPVRAALLAEEAGADQITVHLRDDRRHIQERDVRLLKELLQVELNLEMANTPEMISFAKEVKPNYCCIVPEKREELTTEGGLDVQTHIRSLRDTVCALEDQDIKVSLFIDPDLNQIEAAFEAGAKIIELHTGRYADIKNVHDQDPYLMEIKKAISLADKLGLRVHAGHGLNYLNVTTIAAIPQVKELNIGHAIVAESLFSGMVMAVAKMKQIIEEARG